MKITYDNTIDAAYIYIVDVIPNNSINKTYICNQLEIDGHMINLDFNKEGRLVGIEILDASKCLPTEILEKAEQI